MLRRPEAMKRAAAAVRTGPMGPLPLAETAIQGRSKAELELWSFKR